MGVHVYFPISELGPPSILNLCRPCLLPWSLEFICVSPIVSGRHVVLGAICPCGSYNLSPFLQNSLSPEGMIQWRFFFFWLTADEEGPSPPWAVPSLGEWCAMYKKANWASQDTGLPYSFCLSSCFEFLLWLLFMMTCKPDNEMSSFLSKLLLSQQQNPMTRMLLSGRVHAWYVWASGSNPQILRCTMFALIPSMGSCRTDEVCSIDLQFVCTLSLWPSEWFKINKYVVNDW